MAVDREELAWAAGFFDGEGCTSVYSRSLQSRDYWVVQLSVSQIHADTLERFRAAVGVGQMFGPYSRTGNDIYTFKVSGYEKVQAIIAMLWPWLTTHKKEQAVLALQRYQSTYVAPLTPEERTAHRRKYQREWKASRKVSHGS